MYQKPSLERFGSFRELTQIGFSGASDGFTIIGPPVGAPTTGCNLADPLNTGCGAGNTGPTAS